MRRLENSELHPKATRNRLLSLLIKGMPQRYTGRMLSRQEERCHTDVSRQPSPVLPCWERKTPFKGRILPILQEGSKSRKIGIRLSLKDQHTQHTSRRVITVSRCLCCGGNDCQDSDVVKDERLWRRIANCGLRICRPLWDCQLVELFPWRKDVSAIGTPKTRTPKPCLIWGQRWERERPRRQRLPEETCKTRQ